MTAGDGLDGGTPPAGTPSLEPLISGASEVPDVSEGPGTPEIPGVPEGAGAPEIPGVPEGPGAPEIPGVPEGAGTPEAPRLPEDAGASEASDVPEGLGASGASGGRPATAVLALHHAAKSFGAVRAVTDGTIDLTPAKRTHWWARTAPASPRW